MHSIKIQPLSQKGIKRSTAFEKALAY